MLGPIVGLNGAQLANVGAFLRVLNADENVRSAIDLVMRAEQLNKRPDQKVNLKLADAEVEDALQVLAGGKLHFDDAVPLLEQAHSLISSRKYEEAIEVLNAARDAMIVRD